MAHAHYRQRLAEFDWTMFVPTPEEPWFYVLRPNLDETVTLPDPAGGPPNVTRYRTNADGFRHHDAWPPRMDADAVRILCVGDSYTFGDRVADDEAWPSWVERGLRAQGVDAVAINVGVPGYNSDQECGVLPGHLDRFRPRLCVLGYVTNDAEPDSIGPMPLREVYRHAPSWLFEDAKPALNWLATLLIDDRTLLPTSKPDMNIDYVVGYLPSSPKWRAGRAALVAMHRHCRERGVPFLVTILPDFTASFDDHYRYFEIHAKVRALGEADGFPVLDLLPPMQGLDSSKLRVPGDGHPNAEGQRRMAELIASRVLELLRG